MAVSAEDRKQITGEIRLAAQLSRRYGGRFARDEREYGVMLCDALDEADRVKEEASFY